MLGKNKKFGKYKISLITFLAHLVLKMLAKLMTSITRFLSTLAKRTRLSEYWCQEGNGIADPHAKKGTMSSFSETGPFCGVAGT